MRKRCGVLSILGLLVMADAAFACRTSNGFLPAFSGEMARGYGSVSGVVLAGAFYLQIRRTGFTKPILFWLALLIPIYLFNPGWHYSGRHGDCGTGEASSAHQMMFTIGAIFAYQVAATIGLLWKQKHIGKREHSVDTPPIAPP